MESEEHEHHEGCNHDHGQAPQMQQIDPTVFKRWYSLYPCYINSNLSLQKGRRQPRSLCVPNPQLPEISHCLSFLRLRHVVEPVSNWPNNDVAQNTPEMLGQPRKSQG